MQVLAVTAVLLAAAACGGDEAGFTVSGCPVEDAELCGRAASAADALVAGDADRLVELSRVECFACDELPPDLFLDCAPWRTIEACLLDERAPDPGPGAARGPQPDRCAPRARRSRLLRGPPASRRRAGRAGAG